MKNLLSLTMLVVLLHAAILGRAQYFSAPEPFVEGPSDKSGALLGYANYGDFMLLWEQSTDTLSTAIYYKYYLNGGDEEVLLSETGVHFKNPVIYNVYWGPDTSSTIVYEKSFEGKTELWFMKVAGDGGFAAPFVFADEVTINNKFTYEMLNHFFAWNSDDHLLVSRVYYNEGTIIEEPDTIFEGPVHDIRFKNQDIYWLTSDNDSSYLMQSSFGSQPTWSEPEIIYSTKEMGSLAGGIHDMDDGWLAFSYTNDTVWHINNYTDGWGDPSFYPLELTGSEAFDFEVFSTVFGVKNGLEQYWLARIADTLGSKEVFVKDYAFSNNFYQLSFLNTETRNPQFFLGEGTGQWGNNLYLIFEAKVDGYWQLYYSTMAVGWGSIDEQELIAGVSVFPNPATEFIHIQNEHSFQLSIEIFDMTGKRVYGAELNDQDFEIETINWNRGVYFVRMANQEGSFTRKVVLE